MDKKLGLEHTIRNIMGESLGGGVTTDKYKKTANSFFRPFHAEPRKGEEHTNGGSVRGARNAQKERTSETMLNMSEQQLHEFKAPEVKVKPPKSLAPPSEAPINPTPKTTPLEPNIEPEIIPEPSTPAPAQAPAPGNVPAPAQAPAPGGASAPGKKSVPAPAPGGTPATKKQQPNPPKTEETPSSKPKPKFPVISFPLSVVPVFGPHGGENPGIYLHSPEERFGESVESDTIRQSIENVARPKKKLDKTSMAKQSELRTKVYEETVKRANIVRKAVAEKKGSNPIVDTNPKLKNMELDEKFIGRAAALGGAGVVGYGGALETPRKTFDKYKTPEDQEKALKGQKDLLGIPNERYGGVDVVTDFTTMIPGPIGTASALYGAKRAFDRGDYTDTALNLVSAVPLVGTGVKALKFLGKGFGTAGKAIQKGGTVASDVATGAQLGDIPYQVDKMSKETGQSKTDLYKGIANTFYSDVKTDVVEPIVKKIKKSSIEVFGGPTSSSPGKKLSP